MSIYMFVFIAKVISEILAENASNGLYSKAHFPDLLMNFRYPAIKHA